MSQFVKQLSSATLVCLDGNIPVSTIDYVCCIAKKHNVNGKHGKTEQRILNRSFHCFDVIPSMCVTVWYEPTDSEKACKPFLSNAWKSLSYSSPNLAELCTMNKMLGIPTPEGKQKSTERQKTVFNGSTAGSFLIFTP